MTTTAPQRSNQPAPNRIHRPTQEVHRPRDRITPPPDSPISTRSLLSRAKSAAAKWVAPFLLVAFVLAGWEAAVRVAETPRWLLPPPSAIGAALVTDRELLLRHARVTLIEVLFGFAVALIAGVLLAAVIDASRSLERAVYPLVVASQTLPMPALAPLLLVWMGYGLAPKIAVTALVAFFPIVVGTVDGLRATDREVDELLRSFGAGRWARFRLAKVPTALPSVFSGAKIAAAVSVIGAVIAELVGAKAGLGYLLTRATAQFETARGFAAVALLGAIGIGLFALIGLAERILLPWRRYSTQGNEGTTH